MKQTLLATVSLIALTAATPSRAAPPPPAFTWTGCYVGLHTGGGWGTTGYTDDPISGYLVNTGSWTPYEVKTNTSGFLGGVQGGCNFQVAPMWVAGVEGDISAAHITGSGVSPLGFNNTFDSKTDWLGSVTARFGYAWDRWYLYGKGGGAWAHNEYTSTNYEGVWLATDTPIGWTVGAGLEWAFFENWSAKLEYDFFDFGHRDVIFTTNVGPLPSTESVAQMIHVVKFGVNFHFMPH